MYIAFAIAINLLLLGFVLVAVMTELNGNIEKRNGKFSTIPLVLPVTSWSACVTIFTAMVLGVKFSAEITMSLFFICAIAAFLTLALRFKCHSSLYQASTVLNCLAIIMAVVIAAI